jgi:hypothetical protein
VEEARNHGFPDFDFRMELLGRSWDRYVYAGLRQFYNANGFDPYTQDVAMELGYSLVDVAGRQGASFVHSTCAALSIICDLLRLRAVDGSAGGECYFGPGRDSGDEDLPEFDDTRYGVSTEFLDDLVSDRVVVTLVTSLLRLGARKFVSLMGKRESSSFQPNSGKARHLD